MNQNERTFRLTQSELIARIYARAAAYDQTDFYFRDLLMIDFSFPNDYTPTNSPFFYLIAEYASICASADTDAQISPNLFKTMNDAMRRTLLECLDLLMLLTRESLTELRLNASLCPLHAIDYAICFDDDDPDCAQIRMIHPSHDT